MPLGQWRRQLTAPQPGKNLKSCRSWCSAKAKGTSGWSCTAFWTSWKRKLFWNTLRRTTGFGARRWCKTKSLICWMWKTCCTNLPKKSLWARELALERAHLSILYIFSGRTLLRRAGTAGAGSVALSGNDRGAAGLKGGTRADQSPRPDHYGGGFAAATWHERPSGNTKADE